MDGPILLADIGGTNARFAIAYAEGEMLNYQVLPTADYVSLEDALTAYLEGLDEKPLKATIAIACPVSGDFIDMTNCPWAFSKSALAQRFFPKGLHVINDFEAIALSLPHLGFEQKIQIGGREAKAEQTNTRPVVVLGPGTGLGASLCVFQNHWMAISTEGGHCGLAPYNALEMSVFDYWIKQGEVITRELFLSGQGLVRLYQALAFIHGVSPEDKTPKDVQLAAVTKQDDLCEQALSMFCELLGTAAADQALNTGSTGGVYIGGGMISHFRDYFVKSGFRQRFESVGMPHYVKSIPCFLITEPQPGLVGASYFNA